MILKKRYEREIKDDALNVIVIALMKNK